MLAIKQVPVESDLQEIIKEISIMQQCDSEYIVKYYGSYFKNTDLWIVMEYCGGGWVFCIATSSELIFLDAYHLRQLKSNNHLGP